MMAVFHLLSCSYFPVKSGGIGNLISCRRGCGAAMTGAGPCCGPCGGGGGGGCGAVEVNIVVKLRRGPRSCSYSGLSVSTGLSDLRGDGVLSDPGEGSRDRGCKIAGSCDVEVIGVNGPGVVSISYSLWTLATSF